MWLLKSQVSCTIIQVAMPVTFSMGDTWHRERLMGIVYKLLLTIPIRPINEASSFKVNLLQLCKYFFKIYPES